MKIQRRNVISCSLSEDEVQELEQWGTSMNLPNLNQALKWCIAYTIKHAKPDKKRQSDGK
jgi:hypothetical protein